MYGNHILKAHLGRITEDTPEHQGVIIYNMSDIPLVQDFLMTRIYIFRVLELQPSLPRTVEKWILVQFVCTIKQILENTFVMKILYFE